MSFLTNRQWLVVAITTLCMSSVMGMHNLSNQLVRNCFIVNVNYCSSPQNILGEFNAFEQEELVSTVKQTGVMRCIYNTKMLVNTKTDNYVSHPF